MSVHKNAKQVKIHVKTAQRFQAEDILDSQDYQLGILLRGIDSFLVKRETSLVVTKHGGRRCSEELRNISQHFLM